MRRFEGLSGGGKIIGPSIIITLNIFDFDRCTGTFSNLHQLNTSDGTYSFSAAFSPNSKYLYTATNHHIYQINTDTSQFVLDTVAIYDGYASPPGSIFNTDFFLMYLAGDNRIYITSGNGVLDLHTIEYPDSGGLACNEQQHSVHLPCYHNSAVPNHPNYFLGAESGSACDSLTVGLNEYSNAVSLNLWPNPATTIVTLNASHVNGAKAKLFIYNISGALIGQRETLIHNGYLTQDLFISNLSNGIYFVKLQTDDSVSTIKFVKQ